MRFGAWKKVTAPCNWMNSPRELVTNDVPANPMCNAKHSQRRTESGAGRTGRDAIDDHSRNPRGAVIPEEPLARILDGSGVPGPLYGFRMQLHRALAASGFRFTAGNPKLFFAPRPD